MRQLTLLRLLALAGLGISAYLLILKLTGRITYLVGCGEGSGCDNVLGSRWSQWFGIPVTAFASGMYAVLLAATFKPSRPLLALLAAGLAGAALWFFGILLFVLHDFCPWCCAAHLIGLTCAVLIFHRLRSDKSLPGNIRLGVSGALLALLVLVLGQVFGPVPDTHAITSGTLVEAPSATEKVPVHVRGEGRVVSVFDANKSYNTSALPHLGPSDAPHVIVKYFDYTCSSCKDMHSDLSMVLTRHPGKFCLILLPVPLNRSCNDAYPADFEQHAHTCELARLALAAWRADPGSFAEVNETLFTRPVLDPEVAEIAVSQIVGEEALATALADPWIEEVLAANIADFRQLSASSVKMPKLLVGNQRMLHGLTNTPEVLLRALEKEFKLPPAP